VLLQLLDQRCRHATRLAPYRCKGRMHAQIDGAPSLLSALRPARYAVSAADAASPIPSAGAVCSIAEAAPYAHADLSNIKPWEEKKPKVWPSSHLGC